MPFTRLYIQPRRIVPVFVVICLLFSLYAIPAGAIDYEKTVLSINSAEVWYVTQTSSTGGGFGSFFLSYNTLPSPYIRYAGTRNSVSWGPLSSFDLYLDVDPFTVKSNTTFELRFTMNYYSVSNIYSFESAFIGANSEYKSSSFSKSVPYSYGGYEFIDYVCQFEVIPFDFSSNGITIKCRSHVASIASSVLYIGIKDDVSISYPQPPRSDLNSKVPGIQDDAKKAQDDALGGKTDEEIQAEIDGAVEFDFDSMDNENTGSMRTFVTSVMDCFGSEYSSLLLFSCALGLAIFIIGRKSNGR